MLQVADFLHGLQLHKSFVRTPLWVFLDFMESSLSLECNHMPLMAFGAHILSENMIVVLSVLIAWLKLIGIHGKI